MVEEIKPFDEPLERVLDELMDGDILVFQQADHDMIPEKNEFATAKGYFRQVFSIYIGKKLWFSPLI